MAMIFKTHAVVKSEAQTLVTGARNHEKGRYDSCRKLSVHLLLQHFKGNKDWRLL